MSTYTYSIQNDFPYHKVNSGRLKSEIQKSSIVAAFDNIGTSGDDCNISFFEDLTQNEQTTLTTICSNHSGEPLPNTNIVEVQTVAGQNLPVSGKGTGGWSPDPSENSVSPSQADPTGFQQDGSGATYIRGQVLTDEGSFRDDFGADSLEIDLTGTITFTNGSVNVDGSGTAFYNEVNKDSYIRLSTDDFHKAVQVSRVDSDTGLVLTSPYLGTTGSGTAVKSKWVFTKTGAGDISLNSSCVLLKLGTVSGDNCGMHRGGDFLPVVLPFSLSLSQRVVNQKAVIGFSDAILSSLYSELACIIFEGTDNTKITFCTACEGHTEESIVQLPFGFNTSQKLAYRIEVAPNKVSLFVGAEGGGSVDFIKEHHTHIPSPYGSMYYGMAIWNTGTVASETTLSIDTIFFGNHNIIQISNASKGDPLSVKTTNDSRIIATVIKREGPKNTFISPNWCDKTTWHPASIYVPGETATDSGDHTTYNLAHSNVIDVYHGKITFEDFLKDADDHSYRVVVKVNNVAKTEQDPHYGTGGDYTINYADGEITFLSALQPTDVVTVDYHYADSSLFLIKPFVGKNLIVDSVEVQCSEDIIMNDSFIFQAYGLVEAFAPYLMLPPYNIPAGTLIPLGDPLIYKTLRDIINDCNRSYPAYPALGGSNWRALGKSSYIFTWDYPVGSTILYSAYGMELRIKIEHDAPCGGAFVAATLYATSEDAV
jgi:hypothetical protein